MRFRFILLLSLFLISVSVSGAAVDNISQDAFQGIEDEGEEDDLNLQDYLTYFLLWIGGQIAIVYYFGNMIFAKSELTKVVSIVGIMVPFSIITNFIPVVGFILGLWGYIFLIKFYYESNYLMSAVVVIPVILFEFVLRTAIFG